MMEDKRETYQNCSSCVVSRKFLERITQTPLMRCVVYDSCAPRNQHIHEQLLKTSVVLGLGLPFCMLSGLA